VQALERSEVFLAREYPPRCDAMQVSGCAGAGIGKQRWKVIAGSWVMGYIRILYRWHNRIFEKSIIDTSRCP
jgi:hypothetical protein